MADLQPSLTFIPLIHMANCANRYSITVKQNIRDQERVHFDKFGVIMVCFTIFLADDPFFQVVLSYSYLLPIAMHTIMYKWCSLVAILFAL